MECFCWLNIFIHLQWKVNLRRLPRRAPVPHRTQDATRYNTSFSLGIFFAHTICSFIYSVAFYHRHRWALTQKYINFIALVAGSDSQYKVYVLIYLYIAFASQPFFIFSILFDDFFIFFFSFYFVALSINIRHGVVCVWVCNFYLNKRCGEWSVCGRNERRKEGKI